MSKEPIKEAIIREKDPLPALCGIRKKVLLGTFTRPYACIYARSVHDGSCF